MRCVVLLFAELAEVAGVREIALELPDGATAADAIGALPIEVPSSVAVAVREVYRPHDHVLHDGDTIALIPPVSGG